MNIYSGIDLVEISRIEKSINKNINFISRFFGENEILLFNQTNKIETIAANFAAKEAFSKVLKTGIKDFKLIEVEILRDEFGAPYLLLSGNAKRIANIMGLTFSVSISHTKKYATAIVIGYSNKG